MTINPYKHLTPQYIDWLTKKPLQVLALEVDKFYTEMYREKLPLSSIQENRPFQRYLTNRTCIRRGNQFFRVTPTQEIECSKGDIWDSMKFVYVADLELWGELVTLLSSRARGVSGGSLYCNHTLKNDTCTYCNATQKEEEE